MALHVHITVVCGEIIATMFLLCACLTEYKSAVDDYAVILITLLFQHTQADESEFTGFIPVGKCRHMIHLTLIDLVC